MSTDVCPFGSSTARLSKRPLFGSRSTAIPHPIEFTARGHFSACAFDPHTNVLAHSPSPPNHLQNQMPQLVRIIVCEVFVAVMDRQCRDCLPRGWEKSTLNE
jgi:hypothetical protein